MQNAQIVLRPGIQQEFPYILVFSQYISYKADHPGSCKVIFLIREGIVAIISAKFVGWKFSK